MPLQNRVTPFGNIIVDKSRGLFTGNRGILHDFRNKTLHPTRRWASKAWIYCVCEFKNRKRDVFGQNGPNGSAGWTNLFFLDEATALAAGHRPCFYCQRDKAKAFQAAFSKGQGVEKLSAPQMDTMLHCERLDGRKKRIHSLPKKLPDGAFVTDGSIAYLVINDELLKWDAGGYDQTSPLKADLKLLTPPSSLEALRCGYMPIIHSSATIRNTSK